MGEAKRRKQIDPTNGRQKRGLVVSNPMEIEGTSLLVKSSNLDPQELRFALLFWDELVWPSSRMIRLGANPDEDFLQKAGILTRPEFTFFGDVAQGMAQTQIHAFDILNAKEPNKWALAQGENSFLLRGGLLVPDRGILLELHRAIPVPNVDVPLNDILEFRQRRSSELLALRTEIDSLYATLTGLENNVNDLARLVERIDMACADAIKVVKEWQIPFKIVSTKSSFEFRPLVTGVATIGAFEAASRNGMPLTASLIAGLTAGALATTPALKVSTDFGWRGLHPRTNPYRYVAQYHREVF